MANLSRTYARVKARPAFQAVADPAMHVAGWDGPRRAVRR